MSKPANRIVTTNDWVIMLVKSLVESISGRALAERNLLDFDQLSIGRQIDRAVKKLTVRLRTR